MENKEPKVIQSDANGPLATVKKQPYVALRVKVVDLKVERGYAGSTFDNSNETFEYNDWDVIDHASSNETFTYNDWDN